MTHCHDTEQSSKAKSMFNMRLYKKHDETGVAWKQQKSFKTAHSDYQNGPMRSVKRCEKAKHESDL